MAKKKIVKYEPTTKIPSENDEWRLMGNYTDIKPILSMLDTIRSTTGEQWDRWFQIKEAAKEGKYDGKDFRTEIASWHYQMMLSTAFYASPEYDTLNNAFMAEYNERQDLQELYTTIAKDMTYTHDRYGRLLRQDEIKRTGANKAPADMRMYRDVTNKNDARIMIEKSRETPFQEGDLVLLRDPFVGSRHYDPYFIPAYSEAARNGQVTPGRDVPRIATVIAVTDQVSNTWRPAKGSKVLKVIWMGSEDITDVEQRHVKWHMRPTYKNGMKKRPENVE